MSFLDSLKALFGMKPAAPAQAAKPSPTRNGTLRNGTVRNVTAGRNGTVNATNSGDRPKNKQVFEGRETPVPEWAQNLSVSDVLVQMKEHAKCRFVPLFEMKTIMTTKVGPDGNLTPEYNGIAVSCGAIKQVGLKVAQQNGMTQAYRYCDTNNAYRACCDNPKKCPFYLNAVGENETINGRRR